MTSLSSLLDHRKAIFRSCLYLLPILWGLTRSVNAQVEQSEGVRRINGTKLFVKIFGQGKPLLVVHGGPGLNHTYFLPHLESLAQHFTVIFYDQRACGRSTIPTPDSLGLRFFVEDIEAIRKELGYEKINLFGHSWGAIPAVRYGIDHADRVKSMILCNPVSLSHEFDAETAAEQKKRLTKTDSAERASIVGSGEFKSGKSEAYQKLMLLSFRHSFGRGDNFSKLNLSLPENFTRASRALFTGLGKDLGQYDYHEAAGRFNFPVLILHGQFDVIPLKASEKMHASMPNSKLKVFKNSGHFIFIEEPEKFRKAIMSFTR